MSHEPVVARPPSTAYRFQKAYRRNRLAFTAAGCVLAAMIIAMVGIWGAAQRESRARVHESIQRNLAEQRRQEAEAARKVAETEQQRADEQARKATASQQQSRRLLYAADMNLAQQAVQLNNLGRARRLLERHRPATGEEELRGWEWRYLWQQCQSDALAMLSQRPARGFSVSFSPDGSRLAAGYFDGRVEVWDVSRRVLLKQLHSEGGSPAAHVAFSPQTNRLAATGGRGIIKLHDLANGQESIVWQSPGRLVRDDQTNSLRIYEVRGPTPQLLGELVTGASVAGGATRRAGVTAYCPEKRLVAWGGASGAVHVASLEEPARRADLNSDFTDAAPVEFSPDGRLLVIAGLQERSLEIREVASNGKALLAGSRGQKGTWQIWRAPSWEEIAAAEAKEKAEARQP